MTKKLRTIRRHLLAPEPRDEAGIAMVIAITLVLLMSLIPLAVWAQTVEQLPLARHDQDHEAALAAAEAGVDDYLNHLAQNNNYWQYSSTNLPPDNNKAFTQFVPVSGGSNNNESFRYNVTTTQTPATGIVYLTSTGLSRNVMRTVRVGLRRQGFLDFLWLTDYEIMDPALTGANVSKCKFHVWEWNTSGTPGFFNGYGPSDPSSSGCVAVFWNTQAVLNGPVHSNDALYMCGNPTFNGNTDTYYNTPTSKNLANSTQFGGPKAVANPLNCTNNPTFARNNDPASGSLLAFPPANTSIRQQADYQANSTVTGCLYTGPTTITLNSNSTMSVTSSLTNPAKVAPGCGPGNNLALPANGVVYVQNAPTSSSDPYYWAGHTCSGAACNGDVSLSGTLKGQLTIASQNDIIITGDVKYNTWPGGSDVLGLVADNDVAVLHASGVNVTQNRTIDAAILSLNHSFYVQNYNTGGTTAGSDNLIINGVITQEYRGAVGTFSNGNLVTGYAKLYTYDARLKYLSPPYFLSPTSSAWGRLSYSELTPNPAP